MKPLFYVLLIPGSEGAYEFAGAYQSREIAEAKGDELSGGYRIEAATRSDLEDWDHA